MQALQTWRVLYQEHPDTIFVQNPPIVCVVVAFFYAKLYGAQYVIDSHTQAFLSPKWRWSVGLHRFLSRRALTTIVHNEHQAEIVDGWGCPYCVVSAPMGGYPAGERFPLDGEFNIAVVCSFDEDEPLEVVFEAASRVPEVCFYVTGDSSRIASRLLLKRSGNCYLTGYLSYERYLGLLRGADAIIVLTTSDHTVLMGGFEAVSVGTPLITSDSPVLRNRLPIGTVHVPNTVSGVCEGVSRARLEHDALQRDILRLRAQLEKEWEQKLGDLRGLLSE